MLNFFLVLAAFRIGLVTQIGDTTEEDLSAFVLLTGTVGVAGAFIVLLRERVERLIRQLTDAASIDPLTGLFNRRGYQGAIEREVSRAERSGQPMSVLQADCDLFKIYNARCGSRCRRPRAVAHRSDARGRPPAGRRGRADRRRGVRA